jgi:hypothetical protein
VVFFFYRKYLKKDLFGLKFVISNRFSLLNDFVLIVINLTPTSLYIIIGKVSPQSFTRLGLASVKLTVVNVVLLGVLLLVIVALFQVVVILKVSMCSHEQEKVERKRSKKVVSIKSFRSFRAFSLQR